MITIKNLNKYYKSGQGTYHALRDINLTLPDKGMVFIVGKSGSGKSTLLNVIGGLDGYDSGELLIDNVTTKGFTKKDYNAYRNTYIGFIFQEFNVIKTLSIYDNIALSLELHHLNVKEHHEEIMEIIEKVGLKGKENRKMNEISGGERQRVAIARALIKHPKVIIADEPTGNLDAKNRDIVIDILKSLSKERLVLIVTHDKQMADLYGDRFITIKDGAVIDDTTNKPENLVITNKEYDTKPISPTAKTSLILSAKAVLLNKWRFLLIVILFSFSLIFAGSSVNLFLTNSTKEYANYQKEYNNFVVNLTQEYTNHGYTENTAFYNSEVEKLITKYQTTTDNEGFDILKSMIFDININIDDYAEVWTYATTIQRLIVSSNINDLEKVRPYKDEPRGVNYNQYGIYITDYVADCLIFYNYFNDESLQYDESDDEDRLKKFDAIIERQINVDYLNHPLYIKNVIKTNYYDLLNSDLSDSKNKAALLDNIAYYSSIFVTPTIYNNIVAKDLSEVANFKYTYDNFIYDCFSKTGKYEGIKIMPFDSDTMAIAKSLDKDGNVETNEDGTPIYLGSAPIKPEQQRPTQMAVSRGFLEKVLGIKNDQYTFVYNSNDKNYILNNVYGNQVTFYMLGYSRVPTPLNFVVSCVVEEEQPVIYTTSLDTTDLFVNYLTNSYGKGDNMAGFPLLLINNDVNVNAKLYNELINEKAIINNVSYKKLQVVNAFIDSNLILFVGLFFIFCLFSILLIFNFIIINIKNSTKDIGIYMSLGMNGWKISLIYLFQVLFISIASMIIALIGTVIFLNILDASFTSEAMVNFKIINFTPLGALAIFLLAFITPVLSVIFPLISLSNKKPIDIIKVS